MQRRHDPQKHCNTQKSSNQHAPVASVPGVFCNAINNFPSEIKSLYDVSVIIALTNIFLSLGNQHTVVRGLPFLRTRQRQDYATYGITPRSTVIHKGHLTSMRPKRLVPGVSCNAVNNPPQKSSHCTMYYRIDQYFSLQDTHSPQCKGFPTYGARVL